MKYYNLLIFEREDLPPIEKLLMMRAIAGGVPLNEYEIEGNPAAFQTNLARPLSGLTIPFLPVQSGTGDPSPQNQRPINGRTGVTANRAGKNLLNVTASTSTVNDVTYTIEADGTIKLSGTASARSVFKIAENFTLKAGTYKLNGSQQTIPVNCYLNFNGGGVSASETANLFDVSFTLTEDVTTDYVRFDIASGTNTDGLVFKPMLRLASETDDTFEPYTGQSYPVVFPAVGKNLLPPMASGSKNDVSISVADDGTITINGTASTDTYFDCDFEASWKQGQSINLYAFNPVASESNRLSLFVITDHGNPQANLNSANAKTIGTASFNSTVSRWRLRIPSGVQYTDFVIKPMLQIGGTEPTAYEPFTNTVYGGTVYPLEGRMLVEWAKHIVSLTDNTAASQAMNEDVYRIGLQLPDFLAPVNSNDRLNLYCNIGKNAVTILGGAAQVADCCAYNWNGICVFLIGVPSSENTVAKGKQWLVNNGCEVVRKLATPIEIPLSDIPVPVTLIGDNTIWTDTNGENTIRYKKKG